jgi:hypothetical protein
MTKKPHHPRLLEVAVFELKPTLCEEGDTPLMAGFATSRETAQIQGDTAWCAGRMSTN